MSFEEVQAAVGGALSDALIGTGELVTRWVAVVEVLDGDGERAVYALAPPEAKAWDSLGLLTYAVQVEQAAAVDARDR